MQSEKRRAYDREYRRLRRLDPEYRAHVNQRERERFQKNPELRERKNERRRNAWHSNDAKREQANKRRLILTRQQQFDELWREKFKKWQKDYFKRHYGSDEWKLRRDLHRVKSYYDVDDPQLIEALALARAAKRKMRTP